MERRKRRHSACSCFGPVTFGQAVGRLAPRLHTRGIRMRLKPEKRANGRPPAQKRSLSSVVLPATTLAFSLAGTACLDQNGMPVGADPTEATTIETTQQAFTAGPGITQPTLLSTDLMKPIAATNEVTTKGGSQPTDI